MVPFKPAAALSTMPLATLSYTVTLSASSPNVLSNVKKVRPLTPSGRGCPMLVVCCTELERQGTPHMTGFVFLGIQWTHTNRNYCGMNGKYKRVSEALCELPEEQMNEKDEGCIQSQHLRTYL